MGYFYSFVMPAYKGRYIRESIDSILNQSYSNFELIIVDDCSPDNLQAVIGEYQDKRIKYFKNEQNIGGLNLVKQWNKSISYACGDYIILASDDDIYSSEYLSSINSLVNKYPAVYVFRPRITCIDKYGNNTFEEEPFNTDHISLNEYLHFFAKNKLLSGIPQYTFNRKALLNNNGFIDFPLAWFSDDATVSILAKDGNGICIVDACLFSFRWSDINISGSRNDYNRTTKKIDASIQYIHFMQNLIPNFAQDQDYQDLYDRARYVTMRAVKKNEFTDFLKCMRYLKSIHSEVYPLGWRIRRIIGYLYHNVLLKKNN